MKNRHIKIIASLILMTVFVLTVSAGEKNEDLLLQFKGKKRFAIVELNTLDECVRCKRIFNSLKVNAKKSNIDSTLLYVSFVNCSRKVEFEKFKKDNPDYDYYINGAKQSWNEYQASYSGCKYIVLDNKGEVLGCVNIDDYSAGKSVDIIMDILKPYYSR